MKGGKIFILTLVFFFAFKDVSFSHVQFISLRGNHFSISRLPVNEKNYLLNTEYLSAEDDTTVNEDPGSDKSTTDLRNDLIRFKSTSLTSEKRNERQFLPSISLTKLYCVYRL